MSKTLEEISSCKFVDRLERRAVASLVPYLRNARKHSSEQINKIAKSIRNFGFNAPILIGPDSDIIAGHGRLLAAKQLGLSEVPVIIIAHLDEAERKAYILADNRLAELSEWDDELLRGEIESLRALPDFDWTSCGFDEAAWDDICRDDVALGLRDEDEIPALRKKLVSRVGDLWILGGHRLLVGDATKIDAVERLMNGELGDLVVTDPPYNSDYQGYTRDRLVIANDCLSPEEFKTFLDRAFACYRKILKPTASLYVFHSSANQIDFQKSLERAGFAVRCQIIWAKNTFAWGFGRYKFAHEPIFYCHVNGERDNWYGDKSQSTLWCIDKPSANRDHPTSKPVSLLERALINSSAANAVVVDLFGGSGSTLLACERKQRSARLLELDCHYADCIVQRFEQFSGKQATLEESGRTFSEVAQDRLEADGHEKTDINK